MLGYSGSERSCLTIPVFDVAIAVRFILRISIYFIAILSLQWYTGPVSRLGPCGFKIRGCCQGSKGPYKDVSDRVT